LYALPVPGRPYADSDEGDGHTGDEYAHEELGKAFLDGEEGPSGAFDHFSENVGDEDTGKAGDHHDLDLVFVIFWSNVDEFNTMTTPVSHPPI